MKSIFDMLKVAAIEDDFILTSSMQRFSLWETDGADCYFFSPDLDPAESFFMREAREGTTVEFFAVVRGSDDLVEERYASENEPVIRQRLGFLCRKGVRKSRYFFAISSDLPKSEIPVEPPDSAYHKNLVQSFGMKTRRLDTQEIKEVLYAMISFGGEMNIHPEMSVREELIQKQCSATPEYFKVGDVFCKVLSLKFMPKETHPFMVSRLIDNFSSNFTFSLSFTVLPQSRELLSLEAKERFYIATSGRGAAKNAKESDELMNLLTVSKYKIGFLSAKIVVSEHDQRLLEKQAEELCLLMKNYGFFFEEETWGHDLEFFKSIPSQMSFSERQIRVLSANFIEMIPAAKHGHGDFGGRFPLFLRNRFGEIYGFDAGSSKRNNKNGSIFGCSGSGKSVTVNTLIAHTFFPNIKSDKNFPGRIFIVDFAGAENSSYLKMVKLYGGVFIPIDPGGKIVINPFPKRDKVYTGGKWNSSALNFLNTILDIILEIREKNMNADLFRNIVSKAVRSMYAAESEPVLEDLVDFIEDEDTTKAEMIRRLLRGFLDDPVSRIINGKSTVDYGGEPFVIYDLQGISGLSEKLKELLTFIVIQEAKRSAFEITNSFIVFDEAAQLIKDPRLADLIEELFATARKYNTGVWTVTQNFLSFKEFSLSSKIKINTTTTIFLSHANDEEAKRVIAEDFGLSPAEKEAFESLRTVKGEYSTALFRTQRGDKVESEVVKIELSPFDYAVATSDKEENRLLARFAEIKGLNLVNACAEAAMLAYKNNMFVIDAVEDFLRGKI
ncbi:TraM recognition domain-containing protein [bacterium]|nr:TraM recognition domain-containing protein [bacterium]